MKSAKNIAIIGAGPMAIYTVKELIKSETPLCLSIYDKEQEMGCGMPYRSGMNADYMYCNAFSREIPPITRGLVTWLHEQDDDALRGLGLTRDEIDARDFYPRVLLGAFFSDAFLDLCEAGRTAGHDIRLYPRHEVTDIEPLATGARLHFTAAGDSQTAAFDEVVIATGHDWPAAPHIGEADLVSPWPYTNITALPAGEIGILGSSLSAIDVIVTLGQTHGTFIHKGDDVRWFPKTDCNVPLITMVSHKGIMPEPDFFYPYPYAPLRHINAEAVEAEIAKGSDGLLQRVFDLLIAELNADAPAYIDALGPQGQTIDGFADAYFDHRVTMGGLRALRDTLNSAVDTMRNKETQPHRYVLLRGHENFDLILEHLTQDDRARFYDKLMPVFGDCYAAIPHISVKRVLALYDAGVLRIVPTGEESTFHNTKNGGVCAQTLDGELRFDAMIDARGQAAAPLGKLPFPTLTKGLSNEDDLKTPFRLEVPAQDRGAIYCLAMPQILTQHPFSQGLPNCAELAQVAVQDMFDRMAGAAA